LVAVGDEGRGVIRSTLLSPLPHIIVNGSLISRYMASLFIISVVKRYEATANLILTNLKDTAMQDLYNLAIDKIYKSKMEV
jgi:hypothetical protein